MARLTITILILGLIAIGLLLWRFRPMGPSQPLKKSKIAISQSAPEAMLAAQSPRPGSIRALKLFKATRYPPETQEEKAMWDWWHRMEKTDPKFEWKMPIEFYGIVVDQFGVPVVEATVVFGWTIVGGGKEVRKTTDANGRFELIGEKGKRLTVDILKTGYLPSRQWPRGFEYAEFFDEMFYVPDKGQPVMFKMQKLLGTEPFYVFPFNGKTTPDGPALWLNVEKGKIEPAGDFSFTVTLGDQRTGIEREYTVVIQARNGATLAPTNEEFPFLAPEEGYQTTLTLFQSASDPNYQRRQNAKFYAKLPGGRYAFVGVEVNVIPGGDVVVSGGVRYNEKWSRNLEFDHRKWINR